MIIQDVSSHLLCFGLDLPVGQALLQHLGGNTQQLTRKPEEQPTTHHCSGKRSIMREKLNVLHGHTEPLFTFCHLVIFIIHIHIGHIYCSTLTVVH